MISMKRYRQVKEGKSWSSYGELSGVKTSYVYGKRLTEYEKYLMKKQSLINSKTITNNNTGVK